MPHRPVRLLRLILSLILPLCLSAACERPSGPDAGQPAAAPPSRAAASSPEGGDAKPVDGESARRRYHAAVSDQDGARARAAVADLEQALPATPEAAVELAQMLSGIGEMNRAHRLLERAVERHPGNSQLILGLVETSLRVGDARGALRTLAGIRTDAPEYPYAQLLRARAEILLGDLDAGLALLADAETRFPDTKGFRLERIDVLITEKRLDEALELLRDKQQERGIPGDVRRWLALREADVVAASDGPEAALELLRPLLAVDPASHEVLRRRTAMLISMGRSADAVPELEAGVGATSEGVVLYALLAQARLSAGDEAGAEQALRQGVERDPSSVSLTNLARFLHERGRSGEGADVLGQLDEVSAQADAIEPRYMRVAMLIEAGRLGEARQRFAVFQREYPLNPRQGYLQARFDLAEGDSAAAAQGLSQVIARMDRSDVHHLLGVALELSGDLPGAEQRYGLAVQQNPQQVSSWVALLRTLEQQAKWKAAVDVAKKLVRVDPLAASAYASVARAYLALDQPESAEQVLREYTERYPELAGPRVALVLALRKQGRVDEALQQLAAAEKDFPGNPALASEKAVVLGQLGRSDEAFALVEAALRENGETAELRHARLYLLLATGRRDEALIAAERAASVNPRDSRALVMVGDFLASRGEFAEAAGRYQAALERSPMDAALTFRMGIALDRSGDTERAVAAYRRAIELDEAAVGPRNNLALVLQRQGRLPEALEAAQAAFGLEGGNPVVMDTLGSLYIDSGRVERGLALLEKARSADPASADVAYHLALAYREVGREREARSLLDELNARLEPGHELREPVGEALASLR